MRKKSFIKGGLSIKSLFTYGTTLIVLLAVPLTIIFVQSNQEEQTKVSASKRFTGDPSFSISASKTTQGQSITVKTSEANWYSVYFSQEDPSNYLSEINNFQNRNYSTPSLNLIYQGSDEGTFQFTPSSAGFIFGVSYQIRSDSDQLSSGDTLCSWDGSLFMYKRNNNTIFDFFNKSKNQGALQRLNTCSNSGAIKISPF